MPAANDANPTVTVSFTASPCETPLGSVEVRLPMKLITIGSGAGVIPDTELFSKRLADAIRAFASVFES